MSDLIKKIEALAKKSDKQALVKLGADELGVDLDASKTTAVLAEELLAVVEERGESQEGQGETGEQEGAADPEKTDGEKGSSEDEKGEKDPPAPKAEDKRAPYEGKMLENTRNGRRLPWTAALAKSRHMKEV